MITIIGSGRVGMAAALFISVKEVDDITLIDVVPNLPQGEALDLSHAIAILGLGVRVRGSNDFKDMQGSDLVVVTAGFPRKPGMTREELVVKNSEIVRDVADNIRRYAPESIVILTTNPLDAMTYLMFKRLGFPRERVIGFSGVLDAGRLAYYVSREVGLHPSSITPVVLGQHGENMYPVPRLSTIAGAPITDFLDDEGVSRVVRETVKAGAAITSMRGYSSSYGPGAGISLMVESIKRDLKKVFLASVYLKGEYGLDDVAACVPVVLGRGGAERVIELPLTASEKQRLLESVEAIKTNISQIPRDLL